LSIIPQRKDRLTSKEISYEVASLLVLLFDQEKELIENLSREINSIEDPYEIQDTLSKIYSKRRPEVEMQNFAIEKGCYYTIPETEMILRIIKKDIFGKAGRKVFRQPVNQYSMTPQKDPSRHKQEINPSPPKSSQYPPKKLYQEPMMLDVEEHELELKDDKGDLARIFYSQILRLRKLNEARIPFRNGAETIWRDVIKPQRDTMSRLEFAEKLKEIGVKYETQDITVIFLRYDRGKKGLIDLQDFKEMLNPLNIVNNRVTFFNYN